jgi:hypothetical protein
VVGRERDPLLIIGQRDGAQVLAATDRQLLRE